MSADLATTRQHAEALAGRLPPLQVAAQRVAATVAFGLHGRRRVGPGETFWQFRQYQPSDPVRDIDWRRSARSNDVYIRQNEWETAQSVWIWRDASPSMRYRSSRELPEKADRADLLALALATLLIEGGENVAALGEGMRARHGKVGLESYAASFFSTPVSQASLPPYETVPRYGEVVLVSDFLDPLEEIEAVLAQYAASGVAGHLVQITDPAEEAFPFSGRVRFEGMENEQAYLISRAEGVRERYVHRLAEHRDGLRHACRRVDWSFHHHVTDQAPEAALLALHGALSREWAGHGRMGR